MHLELEQLDVDKVRGRGAGEILQLQHAAAGRPGGSNPGWPAPAAIMRRSEPMISTKWAAMALAD